MITFTFRSEEEWELAIRALDWLSLTNKDDARNFNLAPSVREIAAEKSAQAFHLAREIQNVSRRESC